jgi:uncharacterized protein
MIKPWREVAVPNKDVLRGTFQQAEFAADLSRVHQGTASSGYQNPTEFFERTFITEGMRLLLDSVVRRLTAQGGDPVIQLQTAFGGGKTHTMLAVYHLAKGEVPASELRGVGAILNAARVTELPKANLVVLDGVQLLSLASKPNLRDGQSIRTLWGELAWQLGGLEAFEFVRRADEDATAPGKDELRAMLERFAPCVILIDELTRYVSQFEEGKSLSGGTFDSNLSFVQSLTEALKAVPTAMLLASLPESEREAGSKQGLRALKTLEHYFGRVQALWKPVATEEAFEIVRRRLFSSIGDPSAANATCRAFADFYVENGADFPQETQETRYLERLSQSYPIHPEVFDRLYEDWSSLDNFQRTRGVLKLMAKVIHRLWKDNNNDALIMPGNFPLYDPDARNDLVAYLPQGWDPVVERDIDGERAETTEIEGRDARLGSVQACRRTARAIFMGSAPSTGNQIVRGLESNRVLLGVVQPGQTVGVFKDGLKRLTDRLHYLSVANDRYWFDTRPNLRREMEERKRRFKDKDDVVPTIRNALKFTTGMFSGSHVFTSSGDVPDDGLLRLVVLPPDAPFTKTLGNQAETKASEILRSRGDQPRLKQNRLIFLAADEDSVGRLMDQVRSVLAWQSIVNDFKENKIVLDNLMGRNAEITLEQSRDALKRMVRECYKWLLAPVQMPLSGKGVSEMTWERASLDPNASNATQEIEQVVKSNEWVINAWAPIHLFNMLKTWFWKEDQTEIAALEVWQKMGQYLYLPRLRDETTLQTSIQAGADSQDFFGLAQGKPDGIFKGFSFARPATVILDGSLLLIEPGTARAHAEAIKPAVVPTPVPQDANGPEVARPVSSDGITIVPPVTPVVPVLKRRFYGSVDLDAVQAKKQFSDVVDEILIHFSSQQGVKLRISIDFEAESSAGFNEALQRTVRENARALKFKTSEFEEG